MYLCTRVRFEENILFLFPWLHHMTSLKSLIETFLENAIEAFQTETNMRAFLRTLAKCV